MMNPDVDHWTDPDGTVWVQWPSGAFPSTDGRVYRRGFPQSADLHMRVYLWLQQVWWLAFPATSTGLDGVSGW